MDRGLRFSARRQARGEPLAHRPDKDKDARRPLPGVNNRMMDIVYTALTAGLLALTWGLVRLCERVT
jgi:hypothetical protein